MKRMRVLAVAGGLVFGMSGQVSAVEDSEVHMDEEFVECLSEASALNEDGKVALEERKSLGDVSATCEAGLGTSTMPLQGSVHIKEKEASLAACSEPARERLEEPDGEVKDGTRISEDKTLVEASPSKNNDEESLHAMTEEPEEELTCSEPDPLGELPEQNDSATTSELASADHGDVTIVDSERQMEKEESDEVSVVVTDETEKSLDSPLQSIEAGEVALEPEGVEKEEPVADPVAPEPNPAATAANSSELAEGAARTASLESSPAIQPEIGIEIEIEIETETETVAPRTTSANPESNAYSNYESGNGDASPYTGSSHADDPYLRTSVNQQSWNNPSNGTSIERLPQTGGVMDQTRVMVLSSLLIVLGTVLRMAASWKRKMD